MQVDGNAGWPFSILVLSIVPCLASADFHCLRYVTIGDIISCDLLGFVAFYRIFRDGVYDLCSLCILRKVGEVPLPSIRFCHHFAGYLLPIGKQVNGNANRPLSILVLSIVPCLASADTDGFRFMCVLYVASTYLSFVTFYCILRDGVYDLLSVFILVKVCEVPFPAIRCRYFLACDLLSIGMQVDGNAGWPFSILVLSIVPCLASADAGLSRFMFVGYVISINR